MVHATYSAGLWPAPTAPGPLAATVRLPGSKSLTNRELVLSALAEGPSRLRGALVARDTDLMVDALRSLGTRIERDGDDLVVTPGRLSGDVSIDVGLAGTLMRFLPPVAALADGPVRFDGDERARLRPMATTVLSLRALGVEVDDEDRGTMPFTVRGTGSVAGGPVLIDASASSQFVSGLLLSGPRFEDGLEVEHRGARLPSLPHIEMTLAALRARGVEAESAVIPASTAATPLRGAPEPAGGGPGPAATWRVPAHRVEGRDLAIEPDLSNAGPFLAAAIVAGGWVSVPGWPEETTQVGDRLRGWLAAFGAEVEHRRGELTVAGQGVDAHALQPVDLDLSEGGELAPTLVGLAAFADGTSTFTGIGHLRGHETDRLAALATELGALGIAVEETEDGLVVHGGRPAASERPWQSYADHRMATTGALLGLATPGLQVEDVASTAKTLPDFVGLWTRLLP